MIVSPRWEGLAAMNASLVDPPRRTVVPATTIGPGQGLPTAARARWVGATACRSSAGEDAQRVVPAGQLRRIRWAVRATLALGVAASVAANVLHARPHPVAQTIAAWPPLALLLTVELISRVPVHRRGLAAVRLAATTSIAGIAGWVSYGHMAAVAARAGETTASAHLLPISVDGLIIVASISLVELAGRIRSTDHRTPSTIVAPRTPPPAPETSGPAASPGTGDPRATRPAGHDGIRAVRPPTPGRRRTAPGRLDTPAPSEQPSPDRAALRGGGHHPTGADPGESDPAPGAGAADRDGPDRAASAGPGRGRPAAATRQLAEQLITDHPDWTRVQVAQRLGVSPRRLRHVLATPTTPADPEPASPW
jgi:Protein of unknown function (DUF2637)